MNKTEFKNYIFVLIYNIYIHIYYITEKIDNFICIMSNFCLIFCFLFFLSYNR